jgi:hypothetical protein
MAFYRSTIVQSGDGEDKVREAILKMDDDLKNIFVYINIHEPDTTNHGVSGVMVGETEEQTLSNKTLTAPIVNAGELNLLTVLTVANDVDLGNYIITAKIWESDVTTSTAPFIVASTTLVDNLNADWLDSKQSPSGDIVGTTDEQELTTKTYTSIVLDGDLSGTAFLDQNDMSDNSDTKLASQQSIKAYVDDEMLTSIGVADLQSLTAAEVQQLQDIAATTISAPQWAYLGLWDQSMAQAAAPTFAGITINGNFAGTGFKDEDNMAADSATALASQQSIKAYVDAEVTSRGEGLTHVETLTITAEHAGASAENFYFEDLEENVLYTLYIVGKVSVGSNGMSLVFNRSHYSPELAMVGFGLRLNQEPMPTPDVHFYTATYATMHKINAAWLYLPGAAAQERYFTKVEFWSDGTKIHAEHTFTTMFDRMKGVADVYWRTSWLTYDGLNMPSSYARYTDELVLMLTMEEYAPTGRIWDDAYPSQGEGTFVGTGHIDQDDAVFDVYRTDWSLHLDGNSDYVWWPDSADWDFGAGKFSIDCWVNFPDITTNMTHGIVGQSVDELNYWALWYRVLGGGSVRQLTFSCAVGGVIQRAVSRNWHATVDTWHHVMVGRGWNNDLDTTALWVDGSVLGDAGIENEDMPNLAATLTVGATSINGDTVDYFKGRIDYLRILKGKCFTEEDTYLVPTTVFNSIDISVLTNSTSEEFTGKMSLYKSEMS